MARITIEDCMVHVPNRFQLVRMASIRAKQLKKGARPLLGADDNKVVVMSLREIAAGLVKPGDAAVEPEEIPSAPAIEAAPVERTEAPSVEAVAAADESPDESPDRTDE